MPKCTSRSSKPVGSLYSVLNNQLSDVASIDAPQPPRVPTTAAVAALAVITAIYAAVTVRDPMAKRVKSLNERREQLKSGIIMGATKKRQSIIRRTDKADQLKELLARFRMLQDS